MWTTFHSHSCHLIAIPGILIAASHELPNDAVLGSQNVLKCTQATRVATLLVGLHALHSDSQTLNILVFSAQSDDRTGNTPACKGVGAALSCIRVIFGVPIVIVRYKDGPPRTVSNIRAGLALPPVISRMEAVCLLLTFAADVDIILLARLTAPMHSFTYVDQT